MKFDNNQVEYEDDKEKPLLIVCSGAPRSGKSTVTKAVLQAGANFCDAVRVKRVITELSMVGGITYQLHEMIGLDLEKQRNKSRLLPGTDITMRQVITGLVMLAKELHGESILVYSVVIDAFRAFLSAPKEYYRGENAERPVLVISNPRDEEELRSLVRMLNIKWEDVLLFRVYRDGYTFEGDPRSLITGVVDDDLEIVDVYNDEDIDTLNDTVDGTITLWLQERSKDGFEKH